MKERVVVAMSGGVDSSVAAALLKEQGYEVIGITMCFGLRDYSRKKPLCCGVQAVEDARRVAHKLGIKHYVLNLHKELQKYVISDFCDQYLRGRTPNPCVRCNQYIKFGILLEKARGLGGKFLATGHFARIIRTQRYILRKGKDKFKDQSYFLYRLNQHQLKHALFPLGNYTKEQVRMLAVKFGLPTAEKPASQEICFLPESDYRIFLEKYAHKDIRPGPIVDLQGKILGRHKGCAFYTIGQRQGLGLAFGYPAYVIEIDHKNNRIVIGRKADAYKKEFMVKGVRFFCRSKEEIAAKVKIRYNHTEQWAQIYPQKSGMRVIFKKPQFAVTPGQSAVFYDRDLVLGGGIIDEVL